MTKRFVVTHESIVEQCERAAKIVSQWPTWKRNILENSLRPQWDAPRDVVENE